MSKFQVFLIVLYLFFFGGVGGWVLELFGKIPETNESVTTDDFRITVLKVSERRIVKVRLTVIPKSENKE